MSKYYVAYGSNLNLTQMAYRCPTAKVVGSGLLENYELSFCRVATVIRKKGSKVPVAVWEIDKACESALDRYEGFPNLYCKETVTVTIHNKEIEAMMYVLNHGVPQLPVPTYYKIIEQGYRDVGLDVSYLDKAIKSTISLTQQL